MLSLPDTTTAVLIDDSAGNTACARQEGYDSITCLPLGVEHIYSIQKL